MKITKTQLKTLIEESIKEQRYFKEAAHTGMEFRMLSRDCIDIIKNIKDSYESHNRNAQASLSKEMDALYSKLEELSNSYS